MIPLAVTRAGSDDSCSNLTSSREATSTLNFTVLPGEALEVLALELVSIEAGGKPITRLPSPPASTPTGDKPVAARCIVLTYQGQQWKVQPAAGPGESERWCTSEWGVVVDQRLQAAITCWATTPATRFQAINFIASLCHHAATASGTALEAACTSLVRFTEALPWIDAGYYQQSDFVTTMGFMSGVQALHKRASADGDTALAALLNHMLKRTGLSKEAHLEGLFLPLSNSDNSAVTAAQPTRPAGADTTAAPEVAALSALSAALSHTTSGPSASSAVAPSQRVVCLPALKSLLSGVQPATGTTGREWDLDLDLHGQELRASGGASLSSIMIPQGTRVRLHNGTLQLPGGCYISVGPNTRLQLDNVNVMGSASDCDPSPGALLVVRGKGADLRMNVCRVSVSASSHSLGKDVGLWPPSCVLVTDGGAAALDRCALGNAAHTGLEVTEPGSIATATHCTAHQCNTEGFVASWGGHMKLSDCASLKNKRHGFWVSDSGSVMEVGPGCTADSNGSHGFFCSAASKMAVHSGTLSKGNIGCGFVAGGEGSDMQLGEYCRAHSNKDHGVCAAVGASMRIDRKAEAMSNRLSGFCARGSGSRLETGEQCSVSANGSHGFSAEGGGQLLVGPKNKSADNAGCGFMSSGKGSLVKLSAGCAAFSNERPGFKCEYKGKLLKSSDCRGDDNGEEIVGSDIVAGAGVAGLLIVLFGMMFGK
jgi:hypothetical protein